MSMPSDDDIFDALTEDNRRAIKVFQKHIRDKYCTTLYLKCHKILSSFGLLDLLNIKLPNGKLKHVDFVVVHAESDIVKVPTGPGVYWITTTEPLGHFMHPHLDKIPSKFGSDDREIIYNGVSSNLRSRLKNHLLRKTSKGLSGISLDILCDKLAPASHTKLLLSGDKGNKKRKVPYRINGKKIRKLSDVRKMFLSKDEKTFLTDCHDTESYLFLCNGIDVRTSKHRRFEFRLYYIPIDNHSIRDMFETRWRKKYGVPRLCSYIEGR